MAEFEQAQMQLRNALYGVAGSATNAAEKQDVTLNAAAEARTHLQDVFMNLATLISAAELLINENVGHAAGAYFGAIEHTRVGVKRFNGVMTSKDGNRVIAQAEDYRTSLARPLQHATGMLGSSAIEAGAQELAAAFNAKFRAIKDFQEKVETVHENGDKLAAKARRAAGKI